MYNIVFIGCIVCVYVGKVSADCSPGCHDYWRGDGWCDSACDNAACNYDDGDCGSTAQCSFLCSNSQLGDGTCDFWCNTEDCNYDDGDCTNNDNGDDTGGLLDDDMWTGECSFTSCPGVHQGHCGAFSTKTDKWCEMGDTDICCAENSGECCDPNGGAIAGLIIGIIVVIGVCCYYCCNCNKNKNNDINNKDYGEPPHCCFKFWCPTCAVCSHQRCDEPCDVILSLWLGWFFTLCCWHPKTKTYITPPPNMYVITQNKEGDIEIPATASIPQPPVYQQQPQVYQQQPEVYQQPPSYIVPTDTQSESI